MGLSQVHTFFGKLPKAISLGKSRLSLRSMVAANANQTILKKIVGHKSIMNLTEKVYTHVEIQTLLREVNLI